MWSGNEGQYARNENQVSPRGGSQEGENPEGNGKETSKDRHCGDAEGQSSRGRFVQLQARCQTKKRPREEEKIPFYVPKREDTRKETEKKIYQRNRTQRYQSVRKVKTKSGEATVAMKLEEAEELSCQSKGGQEDKFSTRSFPKKSNESIESAMLSAMPERHFRGRERDFFLTSGMRGTKPNQTRAQDLTLKSSEKILQNGCNKGKGQVNKMRRLEHYQNAEKKPFRITLIDRLIGQCNLRSG